MVTAILLLLASVSCDVDPTGLLYSTDPVNNRFSESMEWNAAHMPFVLHCDADNYRLMFAADAHLGDTANILTLLGIANDDLPLALVFAGDMLSGKEADYDKFSSILQRVCMVPVFHSVGNHELYFDGWMHFKKNFGTGVYTIRIETTESCDLIIVLDSGSGTLGNLQLDWLSNVLQQQRNQYRHCIVVHHVNFFRTRFSTSTSPLPVELYELMSLFTEYNVNMVVSGHNHKRMEDVLGNTVYLCPDAMADYNSKAAYLLVEMKDELGYSFIELN